MNGVNVNSQPRRISLPRKPLKLLFLLFAQLLKIAGKREVKSTSFVEFRVSKV